jgi:sulfoxide reductase heme-binding subunit YedZ
MDRQKPGATRKPLRAKLPWNDKAGRFAPLKAVTLVLICLPALWLLYRSLFLALGPRPVTEAIHRLGDWTICFLLITLAVTPARRLFDLSKLIQVRVTTVAETRGRLRGPQRRGRVAATA